MNPPCYPHPPFLSNVQYPHSSYITVSEVTDAFIKAVNTHLDKISSMSSLTFAIYVSVAFLVYMYLRLWRYITYSSTVPRIGRPGVVGFVLTALKYTLDAESIIHEGKMRYGNKPFTIPTLVSH
jgi:hypothetical protein